MLSVGPNKEKKEWLPVKGLDAYQGVTSKQMRGNCKQVTNPMISTTTITF